MARKWGGEVEIYKRVREGPGKGKRTGTAAARHKKTQAAVRIYADNIAGHASLILRRHTYAGDAFIEVDTTQGFKGAKKKYRDIERVVVLNDTRGMFGAMTIEFGMHPGIDQYGNFYPGVEAIAPLRRAARLKWTTLPSYNVRSRKYNPYSKKIPPGG